MQNVKDQLRLHRNLFRKFKNTLSAKLLRLLPVTSERIGPKKACESTRSWVGACGSNKYGASYREIYPANKIRLGPPKTIEKEAHRAFRNNPFLEQAPALVALIPGGRLWSDRWHRDGAVVTPDNKTLADISFQAGRKAKNNLIFSQYPMPPLHCVKGNVAALTSMASSSNYFHWMFDVLPKVDLLQKNNLFSKVDHFVISGEYDQRIQRETLSFLGIPKTKVIESETHPYIKADTLIATTFLFSTVNIPEWKCVFLRKAFFGEKDVKKGPRRIYISRSDAKARRIINEKDVFTFLSNFGFEKHVLATKPVSEKVELFSSADIIIGAHGAALANIVFCGKGAKVIELFAPEFVFSLYRHICHHVDLEYYYLVGKNTKLPGQTKHRIDQNRDITIDIGHLKEMLKLAGVKK